MTIFEKNYKRKELIEQLVKLYKKQFPDEYHLVCKTIKELRRTRSNVYAADNPKDPSAMRWCLRVPRKLDNLVNGFLKLDCEPKFLVEEKEMIWFAKTFPEFRIADKL